MEGCDKKFTTPMVRKQHLADFHRFPRGYYYETLHLGKHQAHSGPLQSQGHGTSHAHSPQAKLPRPARLAILCVNISRMHGFQDPADLSCCASG